MRISRWIFAGTLAVFPLVAPRSALAQGVTTGAVTGVVTDETGQPVDNAQVQIVNRATGFSNGTLTSSTGRYSVLGLEVGSTYAVTVRRIGFAPQSKENQRISLSQTTRVDFSLARATVELTRVTVVAEETDPLISPTRTGVSTTISDSALRSLPTLNRNFTDFAVLTPQIGTPNGLGLSGGGVNNRFNNIQIDGSTEADLFGLGSTGQPSGQALGKSISVESVKEYQVLLSPYDVRQGNFSGVLINAVTKGGTNRFTGSVYGYTRTEQFTREQPYITEYEQTQYGVAVGGPIVKDRVLFFLNPEIQRRVEPATGFVLGAQGLSLTQQTVNDVTSVLESYGLPAGSAGTVNNRNPLVNVFGRLDFHLPRGNSLVLRHNYAHSERDIFSRGSAGTSPDFSLSSNGYFFQSEKNATALQLRSNLPRGMFNELLTSYTRIRDARTPVSRAPQITVFVPGATIVAGSERFSHGNELDQDIIELTDNFSFGVGDAHRFTVGTQNQFYKVRNLFAQSTFGVYRFVNLDSLRAGRPDQYIVGVPVRGDGAVRFKSAQYAGYIQDQWTVSDRLNLSLGFRVDVPTFSDRPPYNRVVDSTFGRNTTEIPSGNPQYSPRFGFNWDVTGDQRNQLRGGIGAFTGRPAFVWLSNAFQNSGVSGVALVTCNGYVLAPRLNAANIANAPKGCTNNAPPALGAEINLLDDDLHFPQTLRATLGFDRDIGNNFVVTLEGLYTRGLSNPFYTNIALADSQVVGRDGRVVYGRAPGAPILRFAGRTLVLDVENQSKDYSYQLTGSVKRRYANGFEGSLAYTYTRAYDVQSLTSSTAFSQYRFGRVYSGDQTSLDLGRSRFEMRNRVVAHGTKSFRTRTDVSVIYIGQSGTPYEYVTNGDLNADGFTLNDPVYVPRNTSDPNEIRIVPITQRVGSRTDTLFTVAEQQVALDKFIRSVDCLEEQRGKIMTRNSCNAPFTNIVNLTVEQALPTLARQNVSFRVDVFNFGNLLNKKWGEQRSPGFGSVTLLNFQGLVPATPTAPTLREGRQAQFNFDPRQRRFNANNIESNYQVQASIRYSF